MNVLSIPDLTKFFNNKPRPSTNLSPLEILFVSLFTNFHNFLENKHCTKKGYFCLDPEPEDFIYFFWFLEMFRCKFLQTSLGLYSH